MKKNLLTLFTVFIMVLVTNKTLAQDYISKETTKETQTAALKNTVITIDNKNFDYRILKHYSEQELRDMTPVKRNQVHFIYTQSYHVLDMANCPALNESDIDVAKIEVMRKENTSTTVLYGNDCKVSVQLISRNEMQQLLDVLNNTTK